MENKFDYIDNVASVTDGDVVKKHTSPVKAVVLLVIGAGVLYYGAAHLGGTVSEMLSSALIIVGLIIVVWGIAAFFSKRETCACEMPTSSEISVCVFPSK